MLASPLMPTPVFSTQSITKESISYRPSKDIDTFNGLLPPPIEFVEGSSTGTLAVAEGKYEPINEIPKVSATEVEKISKSSAISPISQPSKPRRSMSESKPTGPLHSAPIDLTWPQTCNQGSGLYNTGNTCFINSALQCLLHTPPLLRLLLLHKKDSCKVFPSFCMTCSLRQTAVKALGQKIPFTPTAITDNLKVIAKHMRKGRQEDTHEFLRYAIDSLQKSCLAGHPPKLDSKIAETTWVHKLFGGRLRSRVTCQDCGHNSDTIDRILDLSLDILKCDSLRDALRKFVNIDHLNGADKYKCEKCKKHVDAEKQFTIHEAPLVLTVHLKRFSPLGRKISHLVHYEDDLSLRPFMSAGSFGPTYSLYGVICHAGGGPNSGHYYSFVKSKEGHWLEMNDESVSRSHVPVDRKNAYMLFYIQSKGQGLEAAVGASILSPNRPATKNGLAAGMKKKFQKPKETEDEDTGVKIDTKFIGPLPPPSSPSPTKSLAPTSPVDPQALSLKAKIEAMSKKQASQALVALEDYDSEKSSSKENESQRPANGNTTKAANVISNVVVDVDTPPESQPPPPPPALDSFPAISVNRFYSGSNGHNKKRKVDDASVVGYQKRAHPPLQSRTNGYIITNPYNRPINKKRRMAL